MAAGWRRFANRSPYPEITSSADHSSVVYGPKSDRRYRIEWVRAYYESPPQLYYEAVKNFLQSASKLDSSYIRCLLLISDSRETKRHRGTTND